MPGFWTSDVPLAQIQVAICPDPADTGGDGGAGAMQLLVPPAVHDSLSLAASQRRRLLNKGSASSPDEICVSIHTHGPGGSCIASVAKSHKNNGSTPAGVPICQASSAVWLAISSSAVGVEDAPLSANLEAIEPVELTEVVFGVSSEQYDEAVRVSDQIAEHLNANTRIYRRGHLTTFSSSSSGAESAEPIKLQCLMCQPVSQGIIRQGGGDRGRIIIVKDTAAAKFLASPNTATGSTGAVDDTGIMTPLSTSSSAEQWDLGVEWFILGSTPLGSSRDRLVDAAFNDQLVGSPLPGLSLEGLNSAPARVPGSSGRTELTAIELQAPVDDSKLVPGIDTAEDLGNRGYMSLATLARLGVVSGSWVSISPFKKEKAAESPESAPSAFEEKQQHRAIRVFAWDGVTDSGALALPPLLFRNICASNQKTAVSQSGSAAVSVVPLGSPPEEPSPLYIKKEASLDSAKTSAVHQPALEVAKKVVIARVSSPLAERRDLETHALAALQEWLSPSSSASQPGPKPLRAVKTGDLIAVHISLADATVRTSVALAAGKDLAARLRSGDSSVGADSADVNPVTGLVMDGCTAAKSCQQPVGANELVFYKVVRADGFGGRWASGSSESTDEDSDDDDRYSDDDDDDEYCADDDTGYSESFDDPLDQEWHLWYRQVRGMGLLVQPNVTMVTQTGSVHAHAPYRSVREYLSSNAQNTPAGSHLGGGQSPAGVPYSGAMDQLFRLANASLHPLAIRRKLVCSALLKGNPGTGKRHLVRAVADRLGVHLYELSCFDILADTEDKTAQVLQVYFQNASRYTPCVLHLRHIEALAQATNAPPGQENADDLPISRVLKSCIEAIPRAHRETGFPVLVVATSNQPDKIPTSLAAVFRHEIELPVPDERTRSALLACMAQGSLLLAPDADLAFIAQQTASFVARDLAMLFKRAENRAWRRARDSILAATERSAGSTAVAAGSPLFTRDLLLSGQTITNDDLLGALGDARASMSDTLGVPKIPNVKWDDVGGLADAKKDILDTIRLPMEQPHLFASGLSTRSGLLFYGPPGTGKTLLAKAIATECGLNFFSCKGPELISPYIGESEANVRRIFQKAREASPCVIFFDELDSLAPKRGQQGDSGGVMDRIVSQLLAELDGMSGGSAGSSSDDGENGDKAESKAEPSAAAAQVFAIGATNRPDLLDPALLRPGRFDKLVYLGVSETHDAQLNIIQALTRKFHLHPDLDLRKVAEKCPFHYTGADFYALCSDSLLKAMLRTVDEVDVLVKEWNEGKRDIPGARQDTAEAAEGDSPTTHFPVPMTPQYYLDHIAPDSVKQVTVTMDDFERALDELIPSVSADELVRYQALRRQFDSALKGAAASQETTPSPGTDPKGKRNAPGGVAQGSDDLLAADVLRRIQDMSSAQIQRTEEKPSSPAPTEDLSSAPAAQDAQDAQDAQSETKTAASTAGAKGRGKKKNKGKGKELA